MAELRKVECEVKRTCLTEPKKREWRSQADVGPLLDSLVPLVSRKVALVPRSMLGFTNPADDELSSTDHSGILFRRVFVLSRCPSLF